LEEKQRRNSFEVIRDILNGLIQTPGGMGLTPIMNQSGLTYRLTQKYLNTLKRKKVVKTKRGSGATKELYVITDFGREANTKLTEFFDLWEKYG